MESERYSALVGAVYIFNLIVGTGALTIPSAFGHAGWLLGVTVIVILAFMSYVTATFVVESMSSSNAILQWEALHERREASKEEQNSDKVIRFQNGVAATPEFDGNETDERVHLLDPADDANCHSTHFYGIHKRIEMGQMAGMFYNKAGLIFFYATICIYLYGDLAIYAAAISKTLRDITCVADTNRTQSNCSDIIPNDEVCWSGISVTRADAYRIFVACFAVLLGPFTFFNIQKTKSLQIMTSLLRWIAFAIMVILASIHVARNTTKVVPRVIDATNLPNLFGVCVYSFMCHHSLPSIITPIVEKTKVYSTMFWDYVLVLTFYLLLALTGVFSFETLNDLYTLNFQPSHCDDPTRVSPTNSVPIQYFLSLFPVFTIGANFPIIAITLRNNLKELAKSLGLGLEAIPSFEGNAGVVTFALFATIPPLLVALATENLQVLVGVTGSFAGVGVQYVIPTSLLLLSRKACDKTIRDVTQNEHVSPFRHPAWTSFILSWTAVCLVFITFNYIVNGF